MASALYFIAVIPPADIQKQVTHFKEVARDRFQSKRALNSPPHITLIPPFRHPAKQEQELIGLLDAFNAQLVAFPISLQDFGAFPPRVIFIDIEPSSALKTCRESLLHWCQQEIGLPDNSPFGFHPHMTIAFKDLKQGTFPAAWDHFEAIAYEASFWVREVFLLRFDSGQWQTIDPDTSTEQ